jgi:adenylate cyclase
MACLELVGGAESRSIPLEGGGICHIGRGNGNTVALEDTQISRAHAMIQCDPCGSFYLTDLGSRNGTLVNGRRVNAPVILRPGDRITIGRHEFVFRGPGGAGPEPVPADCGGTVADLSLHLLTIVVTDIRDFTGLSRRLPEARLSELMRAYFDDCGAILDRNGAWGQKYIGDGVMAIWLHRRAAPDSAELLSVFESLDALFECAAGLQERFGLDAPIRLGAGVNTGFGCVGNLGSAAASDYTALSDAVNLAFRLESASKELGCDVVLGAEAERYLRTHFEPGSRFESRLARLKGYQDLIPVYAGFRHAVTAVAQGLRSPEVVMQTAGG